MIKITEDIFKKLEKIVGEKYISRKKDVLDTHTRDWSFHQPSLADIIIWPRTTEQVSKIMKFANEKGIFIVPWGGGTSLEGNPIATGGGIILDLTKMNKIIKVLENDLQVIVQPGIIGAELNEKLSKYGLFFASAPGSSHIATIGGMIANNAGGMYAVKYGVVGDSVLELEVVLADGKIVRLGSRSIKSVSGYDLKRLFIGSEGTLGIVTKAVLKLTPLPKSRFALLASFENVSQAVAATLELLKSDLEPAAIEFMDKVYMKYVNKAKNTKFIEKPTFIVEFHGSRDLINMKIDKARKLLIKKKSIKIDEFVSASQLKLLWEYRRAVRPVLSKILPNMGVLSAEIGIPISQIEGFLKKAEVLSEKFGLETVMFGHIADGNFHGWALYEQKNDLSWKKVVKLNEELIKYAISVNGTTTGEHGIGIGKRKFLPIEHPTSLPIMRSIKKLLDPKGILNPGKIFLD